MPTTPALARVLDRLARLRSRVRLLLAASGVARVVAAAATILVAWFLADVFLDLPLGVRRFVRLGLVDRPPDLGGAAWIGLLVAAAALFGLTVRHRSGFAGFFAFVLAGAPGVLVWILGRHVLSPMGIRLPDDALALAVEQRFRSLKDRLAAALDFDRELAAPTRGESTSMMAKVVEDAAREVEGIRFAGVASARALGRDALLAVGGVGLAFVLLSAMGPTAALWARRSLLLEEVSWPRATTLVAVLVDGSGREAEKEPGQPYVAALGQSISVYARARGRVPSEVEILDRVATSGGPTGALAHRMRPIPERKGLFAYEFRDVRGDFTFTLRGGDDRDEIPAYAVSVRVPPRITGLRCDLTYPEYLGLAPRRVEGGSLAVPDGTKVRVAFDSDSAVARAEAYLDDVAVALEREGSTFRFGFDATKSTRYRLRIVTADGRENDAAADTYEVTVEPDTPPREEWVYPRGPVEVTAKGRVPLFTQTRDDHGIVALRVEVEAPGATQPLAIPLAQRTTSAPDGANDRPYGADAILTYLPLEVSRLLDKDGKPVTAPTRLRVRVVAKDSKGQESAGTWASVDVLRPDEIERGFAGQRTRAKGDVDNVRKDVTGIEKQATALAAQSGPLSEPDRQVLRDLQFQTGKSRGELERAVRTTGGLFSAYVYDRLGGEVPTEAILALFDRRHRAVFTRASDARPSGPSGPSDGTAAPDADTDVFPWSLYREVVDARRDRLVFDTGVIDKMITVLDRAIDAAEVRGAAAVEAAGAAARGGTTADVKALADAITRWREGLDSTLAAMAEWQSLAELTMALRHMIDDQEQIDRRLPTLDKPPSKDGGR